MSKPRRTVRTVLCVSWEPALAKTREMLLKRTGFQVVSVLGREQAERACCEPAADLLILGHSVPREEKQKIIRCFRRCSNAAVLSLLNPSESKLPEADYGVTAGNPEQLVEVVESLARRAD